MSERVKRALLALPELNALVDEVLDLAERVGSDQAALWDIDHGSEEHAGFMALAYVSKQQEHLQSLLVLVSAGQHRDAWLIARTMIEGLAQLRWAHANQPHGPDEWFWYGVVEDWRQLQKNKGNGLDDPATEAFADKLLDQYGSNYYTPKATRKADASQPLPRDPYRRRWNQLDAAAIFSHIEGSDLYETIFRVASDWVHWSPRSMFLAITDEGETQKYTKGDPARAAQALAAGILSLLQSLEILDSHFQIGIDDKVAEIFERFRHAVKLVALV